jgi:16S rRNA (cytosine1402-N4)-methyltransferase
MNNRHVTVMLNEVLDALQIRPGGRYMDVTLGGGGHAEGILQRGGDLFGTDADAEALARGTVRLQPFGARATLRQAWMDEAVDAAQSAGFLPVDGIVADLGLSSNQLDSPERGFSFMRQGPLDMRFDNTRGVPASDWLQTCTRHELFRALRDWGEVDQAGRVADAIWAARPLSTTAQLRELVAGLVKRRNSNVHPATQVFQALRIAVNDELARLARALPMLIGALATGGRLAVISFHSLEDRLVKNSFRDAALEVVSQPGFGSQQVRTASVRLVHRKPLTPTGTEVAQNPRARSAVLRVVEKL